MSYFPDSSQPLNPDAAQTHKHVESTDCVTTTPSRLVTYDIREAGTAAGDPAAVGELMAPLMRHKGTLAIAGLAGIMIGLMVSLLTPPTYRARTSLQIEAFDDDHFLGNITPISPLIPNATAENYLQNEVKLLESDTLARRVADRLQLPADIAPLGMLQKLTRAIQERTPFLRTGLKTAEERRLERVQAAMTVRTSLQSQVIDLSYDAPSGLMAARGANAAASEFMDLNQQARTQLVQDTTAWLRNQAADLKTKLELSNQQLQDFARSAGLVFAGQQSTLAQDRMRQIQQALGQAEVVKAEKQAVYQAAANSHGLVTSTSETSPVVQYESELQKMRRQLTAMKTIYTPNYSKVTSLEAEISETEKSLNDQKTEDVLKLRNDYLAAAALEHQLAETQASQLKTVEWQMDQERRYDLLKSEADATRRLYESTLEKLNEAAAASALRATNVRVIDTASLPSVPYSPKPPLNMAIGLALGMFGGVGLVFLRERNGKVKRPGEFAWASVPELGVIPSTSCSGIGDRGRRTIPWFRPPAGELALVAWHQTTSALSESFRATLNSILLGAGLRCTQRANALAPGRSLVVGSIEPMAGKTTVVTNLAIVSAERHQRVLLIDADLRKPRIHTIFDVTNDWGLTDLLQRSRATDFVESAPLDSLARQTHIPNLWVLPSGPESAATAGLLYSSKFNALLDRFRRDFDIIYIDTPPMMLYADGKFLAHLSDGLVMVVRAHTTSRDMLRTACHSLTQDGVPLLGTILNDWKMDPRESRAYGKYYRHYQQQS